MPMNASSLVTISLRWATGLMFLGKFLQSAWSICPVVEFLGYESIIRPLVNGWMPWESYATEVYPWISEYAAWLWTAVYGLTVIIILLPKKWHMLIIPGIILVVLDAFMAAAGQFFWPASILEKTLMWATPICYISVCCKCIFKDWIPLARYATVIVFLVHGMLALGIMPQPGYWAEMLGQSTGLSNVWASGILKVVGFMDILAAVVLVWRMDLPPVVWYYLIGWGLLTAIGRVSGYLGSAEWMDLLFNWSYEAFIRMPHGLTPLALYIAVRTKVNGREFRSSPVDPV